MIPAPLQRLESSHRTLIRALDANDLEAIESGVAELGHAVEQGAGVGAAQKVFLEAGVPAAA